MHNFGEQFKYAINLRNMSSIDNPDLSNITDMHDMFAYAIQFNQDLDRWDTSRVTDMSYMFAGAEQFNGDVSGVTDMNYMFFNCPLEDFEPP